MSGKPFDDAAKSRLANSILAGSKGDSIQQPDNDDLPGKRTGNIEIDDADNGYIVTHRRRVDKKRKNSDGKEVDDYDHHTVRRVFAAHDHNGMMQHVRAVLASPRHKGSSY